MSRIHWNYFVYVKLWWKLWWTLPYFLPNFWSKIVKFGSNNFYASPQGLGENQLYFVCLHGSGRLLTLQCSKFIDSSSGEIIWLEDHSGQGQFTLRDENLVRTYGTKILSGRKSVPIRVWSAYLSHKTKPQLKNYQLVCTYQPVFSDMHVKHYKYQLIIYYPALLLSTTCPATVANTTQGPINQVRHSGQMRLMRRLGCDVTSS